MGRARSEPPRRRRPSGPPARVLDADALPPILGVTCEGEPVDAPLNAAARRLDLAEGLRRAVRRLGAHAAGSRRWQQDCVTHDGVTWLAVVAPAGPAGAQALLLPVSVDADPGRLDDLAPGLTPREREVLTLSLRGGSPRDISAQLGISWHTVRTHLKHAYRALGVSGRAEAVSVVVESARPRVHLRLITEDAPEPTSGRHARPSSRSHPSPTSGRHSRPAAAAPSSGRHSRPPSRVHAKPPSSKHSKPALPARPPSRTPRPTSRPPSRPR